MTDPYRQHPNPYGQRPSGEGISSNGGPPNPYGQGRSNQPNPYGAQPNPRAQQPDQPNPYPRQDDPYATQEIPLSGQYGTGQPSHQYGQRHDPYQTRQFEPNQFGPGVPGEQYGQYQNSYGQPPGWRQGGGMPPGPPRKSKSPLVLLSVLAVLVIAAGVVTVVLLVDGGGSTPAAAQTTPAAQATPASPQPETSSRLAPTTTTGAATTGPATTGPATATPSASSKMFQAGQCATLTPEPGNRATLNEALCGDSNSDVIVALVQDSECAKDYITFNADVGKVYCLALDAEEGICFKFDQLAKRAPNCAIGTHKVARIFEKITDSSRCDQVPGAGRRYAYPQPARTICLVPAT